MTSGSLYLVCKSSLHLIIVRLTNVEVVHLADKLKLKCETNAGTDWCNVDSQSKKKYNKIEAEATINTWLTDRPPHNCHLEIVDILPNGLLQLTGSAFSFELLLFISHPSVRRELLHVGSALTAFVL